MLLTHRIILYRINRYSPLVIAGKAHPQDSAGQAMLKAWIEFVQRDDVRRHAVFLSDYDLVLAERLVQGTDLWINTPRLALGGMRHQRDENSGQRRAQSWS